MLIYFFTYLLLLLSSLFRQGLIVHVRVTKLYLPDVTSKFIIVRNFLILDLHISTSPSNRQLNKIFQCPPPPTIFFANYKNITFTKDTHSSKLYYHVKCQYLNMCVATVGAFLWIHACNILCVTCTNLGSRCLCAFQWYYFHIEYPQIDKVFGHPWQHSCLKILLFPL